MTKGTVLASTDFPGRATSEVTRAESQEKIAMWEGSGMELSAEEDSWNTLAVTGGRGVVNSRQALEKRESARERCTVT